jgi:catechol 2,3-dioxygenase-like lactoylglutathione lyase family enzyme
VRTAVIGRHSRADLILEDPGMSLRHLLVVVPPPSSPDPHAVGFEVRDLRTSRAFFDEEGRHLEGLVADGPAFVSCGVHALFFLQTGAPADWPEDPSEAWAGLPERVHLRDRAAEPEWWRRRARGASPEPARDREIRSQVTVIPGPVDPGAGLLEEGETPRGELEVSSMRGRMRAPVGPLALARGILLGRYRRCDASDLLDDVRISRAHLLVVEIGGRILALDTASTSGTYVRGSDEPTPCVTLDGGEEAILGDHQAVVRWA